MSGFIQPDPNLEAAQLIRTTGAQPVRQGVHMDAVSLLARNLQNVAMHAGTLEAVAINMAGGLAEGEGWEASLENLAVRFFAFVTALYIKVLVPTLAEPELFFKNTINQLRRSWYNVNLEDLKSMTHARLCTLRDNEDVREDLSEQQALERALAAMIKAGWEIALPNGAESIPVSRGLRTVAGAAYGAAYEKQDSIASSIAKSLLSGQDGEAGVTLDSILDRALAMTGTAVPAAPDMQSTQMQKIEALARHFGMNEDDIASLREAALTEGQLRGAVVFLIEGWMDVLVDASRGAEVPLAVEANWEEVEVDGLLNELKSSADYYLPASSDEDFNQACKRLVSSFFKVVQVHTNSRKEKRAEALDTEMARLSEATEPTLAHAVAETSALLSRQIRKAAKEHVSSAFAADEVELEEEMVMVPASPASTELVGAIHTAIDENELIDLDREIHMALLTVAKTLDDALVSVAQATSLDQVKGSGRPVVDHVTAALRRNMDSTNRVHVQGAAHDVAEVLLTQLSDGEYGTAQAFERMGLSPVWNRALINHLLGEVDRQVALRFSSEALVSADDLLAIVTTTLMKPSDDSSPMDKVMSKLTSDEKMSEAEARSLLDAWGAVGVARANQVAEHSYSAMTRSLQAKKAAELMVLRRQVSQSLRTAIGRTTEIASHKLKTLVKGEISSHLSKVREELDEQGPLVSTELEKLEASLHALVDSGDLISIELEVEHALLLAAHSGRDMVATLSKSDDFSALAANVLALTQSFSEAVRSEQSVPGLFSAQETAKALAATLLGSLSAGEHGTDALMAKFGLSPERSGAVLEAVGSRVSDMIDERIDETLIVSLDDLADQGFAKLVAPAAADEERKDIRTMVLEHAAKIGLSEAETEELVTLWAAAAVEQTASFVGSRRDSVQARVTALQETASAEIADAADRMVIRVRAKIEEKAAADEGIALAYRFVMDNDLVDLDAEILAVVIPMIMDLDQRLGAIDLEPVVDAAAAMLADRIGASQMFETDVDFTRALLMRGADEETAEVIRVSDEIALQERVDARLAAAARSLAESLFPEAILAGYVPEELTGFMLEELGPIVEQVAGAIVGVTNDTTKMNTALLKALEPEMEPGHDPEELEAQIARSVAGKLKSIAENYQATIGLEDGRAQRMTKKAKAKAVRTVAPPVISKLGETGGVNALQFVERRSTKLLIADLLGLAEQVLKGGAVEVAAPEHLGSRVAALLAPNAWGRFVSLPLVPATAVADGIGRRVVGAVKGEIRDARGANGLMMEALNLV